MDFNFEKRIPNALEVKSMPEEAKELIAFAKKHENNILEFWDFGLKEEVKLEGNQKINEEVIKGLDEEKINTIKSCIRAFKFFLAGPIFTDSYHENHEARREWGKNYSSKISTEEFNYYNANRLKLNRCFNVRGYLLTLINFITNSSVKNKLSDFYESIPSEIKEDENDDIKYNLLSDNEKIKVVGKLTEVVKNLVSYLEEK